MDLSRYLTPQTVLLGVEPQDWQNLTDDMLQALLAQIDQGGRFDEIAQAVRTREQMGATCLDGGLALPHARVEGLEQLAACMAVLGQPVAWGGGDARPVDVVCLYLIPAEDPTSGIRFMAAVAELFGDPRARESLVRASGPEAALDFIQGKQLLIDGPVLARDIMHPEPSDMRPDTPLTDVTRTMLHRHVDALPVCDDAGRVVGDIHCDLLFRKGIPDFFMQLASVSFIKKYDPFERYFAAEARSVAGDLMSDDPPYISKNATLMEVLFQLTARDHRRLYVVEDVDADRTLLGAIDRITVLDRVIHQ